MSTAPLGQYLYNDLMHQELMSPTPMDEYMFLHRNEESHKQSAELHDPNSHGLQNVGSTQMVDLNDAHLHNFGGSEDFNEKEWSNYYIINDRPHNDWEPDRNNQFHTLEEMKIQLNDSKLSPIATGPVAKSRKRPRVSPKRPHKAYVLFLRNCREGYFRENPNSTYNEFQKVVARQWKALSAEEKKPWLELEQMEHKRYLENNPELNFNPDNITIPIAPLIPLPPNLPIIKRDDESSEGEDAGDITPITPITPRTPKNGFPLYVKMMSAGMLASNPGLSYNQVQQILSSKWKAMSKEEKNIWVVRHGSKWKEVPSSKDKRKQTSLPRGPRSAYVLYYHHCRKNVSTEFPSLGQVDYPKEFFRRWKSMSAEEQKTWFDKASEDRERYTKEMALLTKKASASGKVVDVDDDGEAEDEAFNETDEPTSAGNYDSLPSASPMTASATSERAYFIAPPLPPLMPPPGDQQSLLESGSQGSSLLLMDQQVSSQIGMSGSGNSMRSQSPQRSNHQGMSEYYRSNTQPLPHPHSMMGLVSSSHHSGSGGDAQRMRENGHSQAFYTSHMSNDDRPSKYFKAGHGVMSDYQAMKPPQPVHFYGTADHTNTVSAASSSSISNVVMATNSLSPNEPLRDRNHQTVSVPKMESMTDDDSKGSNYQTSAPSLSARNQLGQPIRPKPIHASSVISPTANSTAEGFDDSRPKNHSTINRGPYDDDTTSAVPKPLDQNQSSESSIHNIGNFNQHPSSSTHSRYAPSHPSSGRLSRSQSPQFSLHPSLDQESSSSSYQSQGFRPLHLHIETAHPPQDVRRSQSPYQNTNNLHDPTSRRNQQSLHELGLIPQGSKNSPYNLRQNQGRQHTHQLGYHQGSVLHAGYMEPGTDRCGSALSETDPDLKDILDHIGNFSNDQQDRSPTHFRKATSPSFSNGHKNVLSSDHKNHHPHPHYVAPDSAHNQVYYGAHAVEYGSLPGQNKLTNGSADNQSSYTTHIRNQDRITDPQHLRVQDDHYYHNTNHHQQHHLHHESASLSHHAAAAAAATTTTGYHSQDLLGSSSRQVHGDHSHNHVQYPGDDKHERDPHIQHHHHHHPHQIRHTNNPNTSSQRSSTPGYVSMEGRLAYEQYHHKYDHTLNRRSPNELHYDSQIGSTVRSRSRNGHHHSNNNNNNSHNHHDNLLTEHYNHSYRNSPYPPQENTQQYNVNHNYNHHVMSHHRNPSPFLSIPLNGANDFPNYWSGGKDTPLIRSFSPIPGNNNHVNIGSDAFLEIVASDLQLVENDCDSFPSNGQGTPLPLPPSDRGNTPLPR